VRALARDLSRKLGTRGHVSALRRLCVGPFNEDDMISLAMLEELRHKTPDAPLITDTVSVMSEGLLVALGEVDKGMLKPKRIFNLAH